MEKVKTLDRHFIAALTYVEEFSVSFNATEVVALEGLAKQIFNGDCNLKEQEIEELEGKERQVAEAWTHFEGLEKQYCKEMYIKRLKTLSPKFDPEITLISNPGASENWRKKLNPTPLRNVKSDGNAIQRERIKKKLGNFREKLADEDSSVKLDAINKKMTKSQRTGRMTYDQVMTDKLPPSYTSFGSMNSVDLPPPPPPMSVYQKKKKEERKILLKSSSTPAAKQSNSFPQINKIPHIKSSRDTGGSTTDEYKVLYDQVRRFYLKHNPEMLNQGIEHHVLWALKKGVERLNRKLIKKYGVGLPPPLDPKIINDVPFPNRSLSEIKKDKKAKKLRKSQRKVKPGIQQMNEVDVSFGNLKSNFQTEKKDDKPIFSNDKFLNDEILKKELSQRGTEEDKQLKDTRLFKKRLTMFLLTHEPDRIEQCLIVMTKFMQKNGLEELNKKLIKHYRDTIKIDDLFQDEEKREELEVPPPTPFMPKRSKKLEARSRSSFRVGRRKKILEKMTDEDTEMLGMFFAKHDPNFVKGEYVEEVKTWANSHGMASLNRQLKKKYKEDLDEFIFIYGKLKQEIIEFYTLVDKTKLKGLNRIMEWVVVNGREALNTELIKRYNVDLDSSTSDMDKISKSFVDF